MRSDLYTMTRGINRFKGLAMILEEIDEKYKPMPDVDAFVRSNRGRPRSCQTRQ